MHGGYMEIRTCRHLVVLARLGSFTKAAAELNISQPALSRSIQAIERRTKARLFDRDRNGVHLTAIGKVVVNRAAAVLREANNLEHILQGAAAGEEGELAFGMAPLAAMVLLPRLMLEELSRKPTPRRYVSVRPPDGLLSQLLSDDLEFIICFENQIPRFAPVKGIVLGSFPISLLVREGHPLLNKRTAVQKHGYPVLSPRHYADLTRLPPYFTPYLSNAVYVIVEDYNLLMPIAEQSDAILLGSSFAAINEVREGRLKEILPARGQARGWIQVIMYYPDRRSLSPTALKIMKRAQALIQQYKNSY
jgi:DNA-binding transcriptional LysR family regulator